MADILIDTQKMRIYADRLSNVNGRLNALDARMQALYQKSGLTGVYRLVQENAMDDQRHRLAGCQTYLQQTASDFETVERRVVEQVVSNVNIHPGPGDHSKWPSWDYVEYRTTGYIPPENITPIRITDVIMGPAEGLITIPTIWNRFWGGELSVTEDVLFFEQDGKKIVGKHTTSAIPEYFKYKDKDTLGDEYHLDVNKDQKDKKKDKWQKNPDEDFYEAEGTILDVKTRDEISASVIDVQTEGKGKWTEGSADAKVVTGEVYCEAGGGLYVYTKDKDGKTKKIFSPGVAAEIGAAAAVLDTEAEGRVGLGKDHNMLGIYGTAELDALEVEAKGKVAVNRKEIFAGVGAEANLVEVGGTAGVSVLGTDVGVSGSFKVGVGAKAEIGYTDGKVKVDIGAAVGVGFDLGFEVDIGGTVDAVCDAAEGLWDWIF